MLHDDYYGDGMESHFRAGFNGARSDVSQRFWRADGTINRPALALLGFIAWLGFAPGVGAGSVTRGCGRMTHGELLTGRMDILQRMDV
jgi:hypothetical protein